MLKRLIVVALLTVSPALAGPVEDKALLDAALHFDFPKVKAALKGLVSFHPATPLPCRGTRPCG